MSFFDVNHILQAFGLLGVAAIIFAETGLLIGFFLPGDTLLIPAGVWASQGKLSLALLLPVVAVAAILGYQSGYKIGERAGPRLFKRKDGLLRADHLHKSQQFFARHGRKTILLARFIVIVRTIIPLLAGMGKMDKRRFFLYNVAGGIVWSAAVTLAAYWLAQRIPNLDHYIVALVVLAMVLTSGTVIIEILRNKRRRREFIESFKTEISYLFKRG